MRLFRNRSQMTSNVVRTKKWHTSHLASMPAMVLPHFYVTCDLLLNRRTATCICRLYIVKIISRADFCHLLCARWSPKILQVDQTRSLLKARVQPDEHESVRLLTRKSKRLFRGGGSGIGSFSSHCSTRFCKSCFPNASYECENISIVVNITWV